MKYISRSLATLLVAGMVSGAAVADDSARPEIPPGLAGIIGIGSPSPNGIIGIGAQGIIGIGAQGIIGIGAQGIIGIGTQGIIGIGHEGDAQALGIIGIGGEDGDAETLGIIGIGFDDGEAETLGIIGIGGEDEGEAETLGIIGIGTQGIIGIGGETSTQGIIGIGFEDEEASHLSLGVSTSDDEFSVAGTTYDAGGATIPSGHAVLVYGRRDASGLTGSAWLAVPFSACAGDAELMSVLSADATVSADLWLPAAADGVLVCGIFFDFGVGAPAAAGLYRVNGQRDGEVVMVTDTYRLD